VAAGNWRNASIAARNLCDLWSAVGDLPGALRAVEMAVGHADRTEDLFLQMGAHAYRGHVCHQLGRLEEAAAEFDQAEAHHRHYDPDEPWLYSIAGFRHRELLLAPAEQAAWHHPTPSPGPAGDPLEPCRTVTERAHHILTLATSRGVLLDIGNDTLTLARAGLYQAILTGTAPTPDLADAAVDTLRQAGTQDYLVAGLLTRAWTHAVGGRAHQAIGDLDEAWEIAARGPMRLHHADIHLHRARFFHDLDPYPWTSPVDDLDAAQDLIEECEYLRRQSQLDHTRALFQH
jgi:hypothetical protein